MRNRNYYMIYSYYAIINFPRYYWIKIAKWWNNSFCSQNARRNIYVARHFFFVANVTKRNLFHYTQFLHYITIISILWPEIIGLINSSASELSALPYSGQNFNIHRERHVCLNSPSVPHTYQLFVASNLSSRVKGERRRAQTFQFT